MPIVVVGGEKNSGRSVLKLADSHQRLDQIEPEPQGAWLAQAAIDGDLLTLAQLLGRGRRLIAAGGW